MHAGIKMLFEEGEMEKRWHILGFEVVFVLFACLQMAPWDKRNVLKDEVFPFPWDKNTMFELEKLFSSCKCLACTQSQPHKNVT